MKNNKTRNMKQEELEKLVEKFVEKVKENETIQESDLDEFLKGEEICEMSKIERNYILRSAQAITYKNRYDKASTSTKEYITQKCIDAVIGEHKLSGRYEKQCQDALKRHIQKSIFSVLEYIINPSVLNPGIDRGVRRMSMKGMYFDPYYAMAEDRFRFENRHLIPFTLEESIPHIIESNLDKNNDLKVFESLSYDERESICYAVEKKLRETVYDRLRNVKVEISNLKYKSNVVTEGVEHVYSSLGWDMDKMIKDTFTRHFMDKDIQFLSESEINETLEKTAFIKVLKRIKFEAGAFNNTFDLFTNTLDKGKSEEELDEIIEDVFSKYKKNFTERFNEFLMGTGTIINKVRKEIIQKRDINPQKISPMICTPEELETLFKNIVKRYEKSLKGGRTESEIDRFDMMELVGLYTTFFGNRKKNFPKYIKNYQSDFNIIEDNSYKDKTIKVFTTDKGVSFYAITYLSDVDEKVTKHLKFVYIEDKTGQLRVFTPLKGNFIDLDCMEAFNSDSLDYIRETYPEQAEELFRDMDEEALSKYYEKNLLDLFKYNEKVCLEEFESACK